MKKTLAVMALTAFALTAAADDSAALYKSKCAMCHGPTGAGDTAMGKKLALKPLASPEVQKNTDAKLLEVIAKGRGKMPMFGGKLSDEQMKQLVAVVRGFAKK
jgi:mono/diheme cytochrome c family protein